MFFFYLFVKKKTQRFQEHAVQAISQGKNPGFANEIDS